MIVNTPHKTHKISGEKGFTLIEVLVAVAIFSIGFLAVGAMQINALTKTNSARKTTEALTLAEDQAEWLRSLPFYADENGTDDDGIDGTDSFDVLPVLAERDENNPHVNDVDGPLIVRWTVTNDEPIPPYDTDVHATKGGEPVTRSKTIRVWVTFDDDPENILAELEFAKFCGSVT